MKQSPEIRLSGSDSYITEEEQKLYFVTKGSVLVYLAPFDDMVQNRKYLIGEIEQGNYIPSLCYTDHENHTWKLIFMAIDSAMLECLNTDGEFAFYSKRFADIVGLANYDVLGLNEALAEHYRLLQVKDDAFIYQTEKDQKTIFEQGLKDILSVFKRIPCEARKKSKNPLYNAAAFLCEKLHIDIISYEDIAKACDTTCEIEDIARLSNFIIRKVTLDDQWYDKDVGSFLTFDVRTNQPLIIEQTGFHKYTCHDIDKNQHHVVTKIVADRLGYSGYVFYKPLPNRRLRWLDICKYVCQMLSKRDFILYFTMALVGTCIGLILPEMNRLLFDTYVPEQNSSGLIQIGLLILSFSIGNILFGVVKGLAAFRITAKPQYSLEGAFYHRLLNLPQNILNNMDSGEIASRIMGLGEVVCSLVDMLITNSLAILLSLLYLIRMYSYSVDLAVPALLMVMLYLAMSFILAQRQLKYNQKELELRGELNSDLYQYLVGIAKIRLSGAENNALYRYLSKFIEYKKLDHRGNKLGILSATVTTIASAMFTIVLYIIIAHSNSNISSGEFMAFSSAFGSFTSAIMSVVSMVLTWQQIRPVLNRARFLIESEMEASNTGEKIHHLSGKIEFSNVSFSYNEEEGRVISNLSLHISPGEYIGIVGPSGCGKSTLMKLMLGFETPNVGKIYYDNKDLALIDKRELRKRMGVVLQNGSLISGSIQENITITNPNITIEQVEEVIKKVGLERDLAFMPMGLHTVLSEESNTISGGQRQRILIARALVSNPSIIVFDEATSALDNITQNIVCETLDSLPATRIIIAHRLSTIQKCDRIIVLDKGQIVEQGTYSELIERKGMFYNMAQRQIA